MLSLANQIPRHLLTRTQAKHQAVEVAVPIVVICSRCKTRLTLGDERAGTTLECPRCDASLLIPVTVPPKQTAAPPAQQRQLPPPPNQLAVTSGSYLPSHSTSVEVACKNGAFYAGESGTVVGMEIVRKQYVGGVGSIMTTYSSSGQQYISGYQQTSTRYTQETRFFVRYQDAHEQHFSFPTDDLAIRDGHRISELWLRSSSGSKQLLVALVNHNTQRVYPLVKDRDIFVFLRVRRRQLVKRSPRKTPSKSVITEHLAIHLAAIVLLASVGFGMLIKVRSDALATWLLPWLLVLGALIWSLLNTDLTPEPEYEVTPESQLVLAALSDAVTKLLEQPPEAP